MCGRFNFYIPSEHFVHHNATLCPKTTTTSSPNVLYYGNLTLLSFPLYTVYTGANVCIQMRHRCTTLFHTADTMYTRYNFIPHYAICTTGVHTLSVQLCSTLELAAAPCPHSLRPMLAWQYFLSVLFVFVFVFVFIFVFVLCLCLYLLTNNT